MPLISVPDTNVIVAIHRSVNPDSPNREFHRRWRRGEFEVEYSADTLVEYVRKMTELGIAPADVKQFVARIMRLGQPVRISHFHLRDYPADPDDIAFVLCAENGEATHLVSYDSHLLNLDGRFRFRICRTLEFLRDLRTQARETDTNER